MEVTIVDRKQDGRSGKWSYKVIDNNGDLVESGERVDEERLTRSRG